MSSNNNSKPTDNGFVPGQGKINNSDNSTTRENDKMVSKSDTTKRGTNTSTVEGVDKGGDVEHLID